MHSQSLLGTVAGRRRTAQCRAALGTVAGRRRTAQCRAAFLATKPRVGADALAVSRLSVAAFNFYSSQVSVPAMCTQIPGPCTHDTFACVGTMRTGTAGSVRVTRGEHGSVAEHAAKSLCQRGERAQAEHWSSAGQALLEASDKTRKQRTASL
jgi:hypothetical protein